MVENRSRSGRRPLPPGRSHTSPPETKGWGRSVRSRPFFPSRSSPPSQSFPSGRSHPVLSLGRPLSTALFRSFSPFRLSSASRPGSSSLPSPYGFLGGHPTGFHADELARRRASTKTVRSHDRTEGGSTRANVIATGRTTVVLVRPVHPVRPSGVPSGGSRRLGVTPSVSGRVGPNR